jgi:uncharacterized protein (DUF1778 family)
MRRPQTESVKKRETLLECTRFTVSAKAYRQLMARLDAPPNPNARLLKTMQTPAPWDQPK